MTKRRRIAGICSSCTRGDHLRCIRYFPDPYHCDCGNRRHKRDGAAVTPAVIGQRIYELRGDPDTEFDPARSRRRPRHGRS